MKTSEQTDKIIPAFIKAEHEVGSVKKSATNPHFKAKYADLEAVMDACHEALKANGLGVWQSISEDGKSLVTRLYHESAQWIEGYTPLIVGKNDMQGLGSAYTYARRYGLMSAMGIAPEDDDGNAAAKSPAEPAKPKQPIKTVEELPPHMKRAAEIAQMFQSIDTIDELEAYWTEIESEVIEIGEKNKAASQRLRTRYDERHSTLTGSSEAA